MPGTLLLEPFLSRLSQGGDLSQPQMAQAVDGIMRGTADPAEIGRFLLALRDKGETVEEIAGAAQAMRRHMTRVVSSREGILDTCGTGGDGLGTFNISTAAALVVAAAGVPVAKHGNRAASSRTGSADVLAELGVNVEATLDQVQGCLDELGICFCYARTFHASMKHVAAIRRELGVPTIFNLLGPLCNPAGAVYQVLGVNRPPRRRQLAEALCRLGTRRAVVVCGADGFDEVTLAGPTLVTEVSGGRLSEHTWTPEDFGLPHTDYDQLRADSPADSAATIRAVLQGEPGSPRDYTAANAAAALWTAGRAATLREAAQLALQTIDCGDARRLLDRLVQRSHA